MEKLAMAILLAAKLREDSYDVNKAHELGKSCAVKCLVADYTTCYDLSLFEACDKAAEEVGFDTRGSQPVYLLLKNSWNESLAWAEMEYEGGK